MSFQVKAKIDGLETVLAELAKLKQAVQNRISRKAMEAGAKVVLKAARDNLKRHGFKTSSLLYKSIGSKVKTYNNITVAIVGPRTGFKTTKGPDGLRQKLRDSLGEKYAAAGVDPTKYAHLVEGGRRAVQPTKKKVLAAAGVVLGTKAKAVAARPFLRPAIDENKDKIRAAIAAVIRAEIAKRGG